MSNFLKFVSGDKSPANAALSPSSSSSSSSSLAPVTTPKNKSSARPIEISDKKDKGRPTSSKQLPLAQSAPSSLFFMPPKAPAPKPKAAPFEPPPMELPPSPPVYSPLQQFPHIAKRNAGPKPSSRAPISSSAPSHAEDFLTGYNPTFATLVEGDDEDAREREYERKLRQEDSETGNDDLLSSDDEMFGSGGTDDEIDVSIEDDDASLRMPSRPVRRMSDANSLSTSFRETQMASDLNLSQSPTIISFLQGPVPSSAPTTPLTALSIAKTSSPSPSSRALTSFSVASSTSSSSDSTKISGLTASLRAVGLTTRPQQTPASIPPPASPFKNPPADDDDDIQFEMSLQEKGHYL